MSGKNEASINGGEVVEQPMMKVNKKANWYKVKYLFAFCRLG